MGLLWIYQILKAIMDSLTNTNENDMCIFMGLPRYYWRLWRVSPKFLVPLFNHKRNIGIVTHPTPKYPF
jgi:hypothetical protein